MFLLFLFWGKYDTIKYMKSVKLKLQRQPPEIFRPLLWGLKWDALDIWEDRHDIILNTVNYGSLEHWRWIIKTYGKTTIRCVLEKRLVTEFHRGSLNLARIIFSLSKVRRERLSNEFIYL